MGYEAKVVILSCGPVEGKYSVRGGVITEVLIKTFFEDHYLPNILRGFRIFFS